jgi:hypothetical protein
MLAVAASPTSLPPHRESPRTEPADVGSQNSTPRRKNSDGAPSERLELTTAKARRSR